MLETRDYVFDLGLFHPLGATSGRRRGGDVSHHAVAPEDVTLAGRATNAARFIIDHPAETLTLARIHEEKTPALLEVVYTCGRIRVLLPLMGASDVDCPEGITRAPLGDVQPGEARRLSGVDSPHLELREDGEVALPAYTRDLFAAMDDKRSLIYALDYMTSPLTPWKNLVYLRDAAHAYGTLAQ